MTDLKESLEYAVELALDEEKTVEVNEKVYYDRNKYDLTELDKKKYAETLTVNTLQGIIDFIKAKFDRDGDRLVLHVKNPTTVKVLSQLDENGQRENILTAIVDLPVYPFGRFLKPSDFIIQLQSIFQRNTDAQALLEFTGVIKIDNGIELNDNGVSQTTIVKSGAATDDKGKAFDAEAVIDREGIKNIFLAHLGYLTVLSVAEQGYKKTKSASQRKMNNWLGKR